MSRNKLIGIARLLTTVLVLSLVVAFLDTDKILGHLATVEPIWLAAALAAALPHYVFSAIRWRWFTRVFGGDLLLRRAIPEYFLAVFLNQTLPGGVPGDLVRAWRDRRRARGASSDVHEDDEAFSRTDGLGEAGRAVLCERVAGQITLVLVALVGLLVVPGNIRDILPLWVFPAFFGGVALAIFIVMRILRMLAKRGRQKPRFALDFLRSSRGALFGPRNFVTHQLLSLPVVASFLATFWCAGKAIGVSLDPVMAVGVVPVVLMSMTVPITVGGWGVREGAAAALWAAAGLPASQGVAMSVVYGAVILISASPGAIVLLRR